MEPVIAYARNGDVSLAYSARGSGPDLLLIPGFVSHIEFALEEPTLARFLEVLSSFCRLITYDKRGTGLSDRGIGIATLEDHMSDALAVMEASGVPRAHILGFSEGGATALLLAATRPDRVSGLLVYGAGARVAEAPDYPIGTPCELIEWARDYMADGWGTGVGLDLWAPSVSGDQAVVRWWAQFQRLSAGPRDIRNAFNALLHMDIREALPAITVPTLVMHRVRDIVVPIALGRYIAEHVPGARMVELDGEDHLFWTQNVDEVLAEIEQVVTGTQSAPEPRRKLATVLFTDIVGSTGAASEKGDSEWRNVLARHDAMVRRALDRFGGEEVKTTGDGFLATFDGPTSAIRCGTAVVDGAVALGLQVRVGVHTGEVELLDRDIGGIGVHIARRVMDLASPGEVWTSATVPGIVVGSGARFASRGSHALKGLPGDWELYAVAGA
ncbi:MAG TPA: alpha/beta fold hydrolase [Actinomycetota bacterium]|nr:alpha/beta fold hydrolase [Actinomycetota bacterium]